MNTQDYTWGIANELRQAKADKLRKEYEAEDLLHQGPPKPYKVESKTYHDDSWAGPMFKTEYRKDWNGETIEVVKNS